MRWSGWLIMGLLGCGGGDSTDGAVTDSGAPELDSAAVDSSVPDTSLADTSVPDTFVADTSVADTFVADTSVADTFVADSFVADTFVADTFVADTFVADTFVADTAKSDVAADTGFATSQHVHIYISNTCAVSTSPVSFDVPAGLTVKIAWHNHSADYRADVWASYGGGFLGLEKGATWNETYEHCFVKSTHTEYVDVTPEGSPSSCGKQRVFFYCHAP